VERDEVPKKDLLADDLYVDLNFVSNMKIRVPINYHQPLLDICNWVIQELPQGYSLRILDGEPPQFF
jgi:hypothetical protein